MNRVRSLTLALMTAAFVTSPASQALAEEERGWIGGLLGMTVPNRDRTSARPMWGISAGAKLGTEYGIGAYYLNSNNDEELSAGGPKVNFGWDMYGIEGAYHFEGEARGVYVGGRIGMSKLKVGDATSNPGHWGAVLGYNHWIADNVSIGGEASFMSVASSSLSTTGASTSVDSFSLLNFLLSAKLWF